MSSRGTSITISYQAWDTSANAGKTGDSGNHTLRWVKDGTSSATSNSPSEVDSTNCPGLYKLTLTGTECTCDFGTLHGKSSTANVALMPISVSFDNLPASPAAVGSAMTLTAGERNSCADALLARNIAGGSSTGRIVTDALRALRNKWTVVAGIYTVTQEDDTTTAWTATVSTDASAVPIIGNDPA